MYDLIINHHDGNTVGDRHDRGRVVFQDALRYAERLADGVGGDHVHIAHQRVSGAYRRRVVASAPRPTQRALSPGTNQTE